MFVTTLAGAGAALLLPGTTGTTAAGATLLAVGALALLAGHTWGLMVSIPSHLTLVGRIWPHLHAGHAHVVTGDTLQLAATALVLVTALPTLALAAVVLPQIARHLLPQATPRSRAVVVGAAALALAAAMILPVL